MAKHRLAVLQLDEVRIADFRRSLRQHLLQRTLALDQRQAAQIVPVEIEQVEGHVDQPVRVFLGELAPQRLEIRQAGLADHGRFAVDDQLPRRKRLGCACDLAELLGPVIAAAGEDPDPAVVDMQLRAVAINLDLMQPVGPLGGALAQRRVAGRDEPRIGRGLGAGEGGAAAAPGRTLQRDGTHAGSMGPLGAGSPSREAFTSAPTLRHEPSALLAAR